MLCAGIAVSGDGVFFCVAFFFIITFFLLFFFFVFFFIVLFFFVVYRLEITVPVGWALNTNN